MIDLPFKFVKKVKELTKTGEFYYFFFLNNNNMEKEFILW